jgi:heat shock protein HslJ
VTRALVAVALLLAGCGSKSGPERTPAPETRPSPPSPVPAASDTPRARIDSSPATVEGVKAAPALMGTQWTLRTLRGQPAMPGNRGKRLTLRLADDGVASGFAGCNQFSARFSNTDSRLKLKPVVATKMACPRGMTIERDYLDVLNAVEGWRRNGATLELVAGDEVLAIYDEP